jgi:hypothetical protein
VKLCSIVLTTSFFAATSVYAGVPPSKQKMDFAFVLLKKPGLPRGVDVASAFKPFARDGQRLEFKPGTGKAAKDVLEFSATPGGTVFVASMPVPVPKREADDAAQFSLSAMGTGWTLPAHSAHLIVTMPASEAKSRVATLSCFTSVLAAVLKASGAVGLYWGHAGATHDSEFFMSLAEDADADPRIMLWTGVSTAREADGGLSLLSLGMQQLDLPDLLLVVPKSTSGGDAFATFFDLLTYVAKRGSAPPEGDTVGRTAEERWPVRYVPSPIDAKEKVWRVELK